MENNVTTFGDLFKKSFLEMFPDAIDPWSLVLTLAMSLLLGLGSSWCTGSALSAWCTITPSTSPWW